MTDHLKIAFAQMPQRVGDLRGNADAMLSKRAEAGDVDLIVFPEMQLIGYPAEDMIEKPAVSAQASVELHRLARATGNGGPAMLVGTLIREGDALYNSVVLLDGGSVAAVRHKHELPNYGTFDEKRHFAPGPLAEPVDFKGVKIGIPICEDSWFPAVCANLKAKGAELLIAPHGSPYEIDKDDFRAASVIGARVRETGLPMVFLNRVGGQDELTFDGASFILNSDGSLVHQLPDWEEHLRITHWQREPDGWRCEPGAMAALEPHPSDLYHAMMIGLRDYVNANRFPGVILGLSGGIDSAICAAIAADALGPDRVWCVMLPSRFTSQASLDDAAECAAMIGCRLDTIPIAPAVEAFDVMLSGPFADKDYDLTEENIQSRIRGVTLMALSNKFGPMLVTTGNKSEIDRKSKRLNSSHSTLSRMPSSA